MLTQYDAGLEVPEDITLLLADDNQGSLRRVLSGNEKDRPGRGGVSFCFTRHLLLIALIKRPL